MLYGAQEQHIHQLVSAISEYCKIVRINGRKSLQQQYHYPHLPLSIALIGVEKKSDLLMRGVDYISFHPLIEK
jgi:hypothetical protein